MTRAEDGQIHMDMEMDPPISTTDVDEYTKAQYIACVAMNAVANAATGASDDDWDDDE